MTGLRKENIPTRTKHNSEWAAIEATEIKMTNSFLSATLSHNTSVQFMWKWPLHSYDFKLFFQQQKSDSPNDVRLTSEFSAWINSSVSCFHSSFLVNMSNFNSSNSLSRQPKLTKAKGARIDKFSFIIPTKPIDATIVWKNPAIMSTFIS